LSTLLIACDSESSSNNSRGFSSSGSRLNTDENGNQIAERDDTVVEIDPEGNTTILEDPSGNATVTENSEGGNTVNTNE